MRIGRFAQDEVWPEAAPSSDIGSIRLKWLRRWARDVAAAQSDPSVMGGAFTWILGNALFRIEGLLTPTGDLRDQVGGLYQRYCSTEPDEPVAADLLRLAERDDEMLLPDLVGDPSTGEPEPLTPADIAMHCSTSSSALSLEKQGQAAGALEAAVYGPSWLLAWRACNPGVAALLAVPLRIQHPGFFVDMGLREPLVDPDTGALRRAAVVAAIHDAVVRARVAHPGLDLDPDALNHRSVLRLCTSFQDALRGADFAPDAVPVADRVGAPDFAAAEEALVAGSREAISRFAASHPDDEVSFFAFDSNPIYGEFLVSFDTTSSSRASARGYSAEVVAGRQRLWGTPDPDHWKKSQSVARATMPLDYDPVVGDFAHHMFHEIKFSWDAFLGSDAYARLNRGGEDGWIEGQVRLVLARVCDRLVDEGAFDALRRAPVLRVGYAYHGEPEAIVCRIVWA